MSSITQLRARGARVARISSAFFSIGARTAMNYPINFAMSQLQPAFSIVAFYFVARFVDRTSASVGGDYYTFVVIGILANYVLAGPLTGFGNELQGAVQQGRFEMILVEPVRWRLLPFGLVQWPIVSRALGAIPAFALATVLGAHFTLAGMLTSALVLILGVMAVFAIGVVSASVLVLAKRSDPFLTIYTLAAPILAGALFPLDVLPGWIRWMSWLVPHTYVLSALRKEAMPGGIGVAGPSVQQALIGLLLFVLVAYPLVMWFFGRVMELGRRYGLLGGY